MRSITLSFCRSSKGQGLQRVQTMKQEQEQILAMPLLIAIVQITWQCNTVKLKFLMMTQGTVNWGIHMPENWKFLHTHLNITVTSSMSSSGHSISRLSRCRTQTMKSYRKTSLVHMYGKFRGINEHRMNLIQLPSFEISTKGLEI